MGHHEDHREVRRRVRETAAASGRRVDEMRAALIASVGTMPPDEQRTLRKRITRGPRRLAGGRRSTRR